MTSVLGAMPGGRAPLRPGLYRSWGDGADDRRPHVIIDIDLSSAREDQYSVCGPCDTIVVVGDFLTLDRAWDAHRGVEYHAPTVGQLATDDEVADFLKHVEDPNYETPMAGGLAVTSRGVDLEDLADLVDRLLVMRAACTCDTTPITECPNYAEADKL